MAYIYSIFTNRMFCLFHKCVFVQEKDNGSNWLDASPMSYSLEFQLPPSDDGLGDLLQVILDGDCLAGIRLPLLRKRKIMFNSQGWNAFKSIACRLIWVQSEMPQCEIVCSGAYFRGYFHIFLHIISVFNWVLGTYCHIVFFLSIKKKKKKKKNFPLFGNFRKSGYFRKCDISVQCTFCIDPPQDISSTVFALMLKFHKSLFAFFTLRIFVICERDTFQWSIAPTHNQHIIKK